MPQMFDPNQPMDPDSQIALLSQPVSAQPAADQFNFERRAQAIEARKRALTDAMRRRAGLPVLPQMPQGQMVGGHYVAPSWTQQLAAALQPMFAQADVTAQQQALDKATGEYEQADQAAAAAHQARMPQPRQQVLQGPTEDGQPLTGTVQPTTQERMQWAQEGMSIPSRKQTLTKLMDDLAVNEPVREEGRQFRAQESEANRASQLQMNRERLQQRAEEAEQRARDAQASREDRAAARQEANDLRRELAREANETRRALIAAQLEKADKPKPVPQGIMKDLGAAQDHAATMNDLARTFSPDYAGLTMGARTRAGNYLGTDADAVEWWKNYRKQSELTERHALFGAALTPTEQESWRNADIGPTTDPKVIQRNLATRARLAAKVYATARDRAIRSGYPGVADAFDEPAAAPTSRDGGASGSWDAPVRVNTKAERDKLPPGTRYIDPQGNVSTR